MSGLSNAHTEQGADGGTSRGAGDARPSFLHSLGWGLLTSVVVFFVARLVLYLIDGSFEVGGLDIVGSLLAGFWVTLFEWLWDNFRAADRRASRKTRA